LQGSEDRVGNILGVHDCVCAEKYIEYGTCSSVEGLASDIIAAFKQYPIELFIEKSHSALSQSKN